MQASDRLLTRSEVTEYLNIGTTFIEQLRRQGKLQATVFQASAFSTRKATATSRSTTALSSAPQKTQIDKKAVMRIRT